MPASPVRWIGRVDTFFPGRMADVRLWNTARSAEEIRTNRFAKLSGTEPGLVGLWRFDREEEPGPAARKLQVLRELSRISIASLYCDAAGAMWVGTQEGVRRYSDGGGTTNGPSLTSWTRQDGLAPGPVSSIFQAADGAMWFGTMGGGVSRLDPAASPGGTNAFVTYSTLDGLAETNVYAITQDRSGAMWFASGPAQQRGQSATDGHFPLRRQVFRHFYHTGRSGQPHGPGPACG